MERLISQTFVVDALNNDSVAAMRHTTTIQSHSPCSAQVVFVQSNPLNTLLGHGVSGGKKYLHNLGVRRFPPTTHVTTWEGYRSGDTLGQQRPLSQLPLVPKVQETVSNAA